MRLLPSKMAIRRVGIFLPAHNAYTRAAHALSIDTVRAQVVAKIPAARGQSAMWILASVVKYDHPKDRCAA